MTECFFTNLETIAISNLKEARKSIRAAVAWINFRHYGDVFDELLDKNVKIKILLNNDGINQRYMEDIQYLNSRGAEIRLVNFSGIMHHKFCVIDKKLCMFGSFNWTESANVRNVEDLNLCDDYNVVAKYLLEFKALWDLGKDDIRLLTRPVCCPRCKTPIVNILFMEQEGEYQTRIDVMQQCFCSQKKVYTDYYDLSVYNNYIALIDKFDNEIAAMQESGDIMMYQQLIIQEDFTVANYLSNFRNNRMGLPIIHAVGVKTWEWFDKHDGKWIYKIIWKERGTEGYIYDEYEIFDENFLL